MARSTMQETTVSGGNLTDQARSIISQKRTGQVCELCELVRRAQQPKPGDAARLIELLELLGLSLADVDGLAALLAHIDECETFFAWDDRNPVASPEVEIREVEEWITSETERVKKEGEAKLLPLKQQREERRWRGSAGSEARNRLSRFKPALAALADGKLTEVREYLGRAGSERLAGLAYRMG